MQIYHVSFDKDAPLKKLFIPRIPTSTAPNENHTVKRICFSESIKGAITAIHNFQDKLSNSDHLTVYRMNTSKLSKSALIPVDKVYSDYVGDASITRECWVLKQCKLTGIQYKILNYGIDYAYIVHDSLKNDLLEYISDNYKLSKSTLTALSKYDSSTLINDKLYNYDIPIGDIADYFNLECIDIVVSIQLQRIC